MENMVVDTVPAPVDPAPVLERYIVTLNFSHGIGNLAFLARDKKSVTTYDIKEAALFASVADAHFAAFEIIKLDGMTGYSIRYITRGDDAALTG